MNDALQNIQQQLELSRRDSERQRQENELQRRENAAQRRQISDLLSAMKLSSDPSSSQCGSMRSESATIELMDISNDRYASDDEDTGDLDGGNSDSDNSMRYVVPEASDTMDPSQSALPMVPHSGASAPSVEHAGPILTQPSVPIVAPTSMPVGPGLTPEVFSLDLGDGTVFTYTLRDLPRNLPSPSFATKHDPRQGIDRLMRIWDNLSPSWNPEQQDPQHPHPLVVKNVKLPLRLLPHIYRGKGHAWEQLKQRFSEWELIVAAWLVAGSRELFWQQFCVSPEEGTQARPAGSPLLYTALIKRAREEMNSKNSNLLASIKTYHGADYDNLFRYRKNGVFVPITAPMGIILKHDELMRQKDQPNQLLQRRSRLSLLSQTASFGSVSTASAASNSSHSSGVSY